MARRSRCLPCRYARSRVLGTRQSAIFRQDSEGETRPALTVLSIYGQRLARNGELDAWTLTSRTRWAVPAFEPANDSRRRAFQRLRTASRLRYPRNSRPGRKRRQLTRENLQHRG